MHSLNDELGSNRTLKRVRARLRQKAQILATTEYRCAYCDKFLLMDAGEFLDSTLDHFHPRSKGGSNDKANLVPSCHSCNQLKGSTVVASIQEARDIIGGAGDAS